MKLSTLFLFLLLALPRADGGGTVGPPRWSREGPPGVNALSIAVDAANPALVYLADGNGLGVLRSLDGGETWGTANNGISIGIDGRVYVQAIATDPSTPGTIYAAGASDVFRAVIYKSVDAGDHWEQEGSFVADLQFGIRCLAVDPREPSHLYIGTNSRYFGLISKTTDGGQTWLPTAYSGGLVEVIRFSPNRPGVVYVGRYAVTVGGASGGLLISHDRGDSWTPVGGGLPETAITDVSFEPSSPSALYAAATNEGLFRSTDSGRTWSHIESLPGPPTTVIRVAASPGSTMALYVGVSSDGQSFEIFRSSDRGETWMRIDGGFATIYLNALRFDSQGLVLYAATQDGVFVLRLGRDFRTVPPEDPPPASVRGRRARP